MNRTLITTILVTLFLFSQAPSALAASTLRFELSSYPVAENVGEVLLAVTRTGDLDTSVSVDYATTNTTATAGTDYTAANGTLSFPAGNTNQTIRIAILNDSVRESAAETFFVALSNPSAGAVLGSPNRATVRIDDNDGTQVEFPQYWGGEGTGFLVVAVVRGPDANTPATVDYATANGTALAGNDYTETRGTLSFTA